ncbi:MAG: TonB-dependent receptor [Planctomycetes bacterium]|nr:TonB-dependent receptor [Planctomycetota bacterium]
MVGKCWLFFIALSFSTATIVAQQGSIRGTVYDKDFDVPLAGARVFVAERKIEATSTDQGTYAISQLPPGTYTLIFSKQGYVEQVRADVVVAAAQVTEIDVWLAGDFTDLEEFVVQDLLRLGAGTDAALLQFRIDNPSFMNSISADLMSQAGASDAAGALKLISGASIQGGKFAVVRGLPDRYVSSQVNGVRLPSADADTRAVELDQFPSSVIDSISVTKTFTPDQQGDASGGAVNVRLRGIPKETFKFSFRSQLGYNTKIGGHRDDFLSYDGGGVNFAGRDDGTRVEQPLNADWTGAYATSTTTAPIDMKWTMGLGASHEFDNGLRVGAFASYLYERDSSYYDNGIDDSLWIAAPGEGLQPRWSQGTPSDGDFKTSLYDITRATQSMQRGGVMTAGIEFLDQSITLAYVRTRTTEDSATLSTDTRGKEFYFGENYDPYDPDDPGNTRDTRFSAPYLRNESLVYNERLLESKILQGTHVIPTGKFGSRRNFEFLDPELSWTLSRSQAKFDEPDKRQFGALWVPESNDPGAPPFVPPFTRPAEWLPLRASNTFLLGNAQRIFKKIEEESEQYALDLKFPFEQWDDRQGYFKFGVFEDKVDRTFEQETYSNQSDVGIGSEDTWTNPWSVIFPIEGGHDIVASDRDVNYLGKQNIRAQYAMVDLPLFSSVNVIGGVRRESMLMSTTLDPDAGATYFPPGASTSVALNPGDADVSIDETKYLPALAFLWTPIEHLTFRAAYSETVARQTFREITPIQQQEFLGAPTFIGNPDLQMAELKNYDLRVDYTPFENGLLSVSYFKKDITNPIEFVTRVTVGFDYTTPLNFPDGTLEGWEFEARQDLGVLTEVLDGLTIGGNLTLIDSEVSLPQEEIDNFSDPAIDSPRTTRASTNAPERLYNLFLSYDIDYTRTRLGVFYTVTGDTLVAGAGIDNGNLVPDIWDKEYDSLNVSITQGISDYIDIRLRAKNLTNTQRQTEYRPLNAPSLLETSRSAGIDYSLSIGGSVSF